MKDRIAKEMTAKSQMLAMISHDLRTPLTRMKLQLEFFPDFEEKEDFEYNIKSMQYMIDSYLDFAKGQASEQFCTIDLKNWLDDFLKKNYKNANISFEYDKDNNYSARVKTHAFNRAISNIIDNALKYASRIWVNILNDDNIYIIIEDNGPGIADVDKLKIFTPFYKVDKSRTFTDNSSIGLGLTITKEIITNHDALIDLENSKHGGLKIIITLPKIDKKRIDEK